MFTPKYHSRVLFCLLFLSLSVLGSHTKICSEITAREPVKCLNENQADISGTRLSAHTRFNDFPNQNEIWHVWYHNGKKYYQAKLRPSMNGWRGTTNINVAAIGQSGIWRLA